MKRNIIKSIVLAGFACLSLASCGDFLEIEPKTFVSEDNFWNEKTDIDNMVIGTYTKMQSDAFIRRCIMWGETRSDNVQDGLNCTKELDIYRTLQEHLLYTNQFSNWEAFYSVINQCNIIIARAPEVSEKDPVYTQSDVLATQAEMSFLRDLCYFYLVRAFKDVPYYTNAIQSDEEAQPIAATNGDEIVKALIADLESVVGNALKAYPKDSNTRYNSNCNRATQNSIYALLADLCLWDGQYRKCVEYSQKVIDAKMQDYRENYENGRNEGSSSSIISGGGISSSSPNVSLFKWSEDTGEGYPLIPCFSGNNFGNDYNSIFGGYGNSFESIFELAFTTSGNDSYLSNSACGALYGNHYAKDGNSGKGFLTASDELVSDLPNKQYRIFDHQYDCRYYSSLTTDDAYSTAYSSKFVDYMQTVVATSSMSSSQSPLPYTAVNSVIMGNYHDRNWIFYRLTDVMLMQAEALIELAAHDSYIVVDEDGNRLVDENGNVVLDEDLKRAFGLIYAVNRRSILAPSLNSTSVVTSNELKIGNYGYKSMMRTLCMKERRRELLFEGKRWFDLLRYCHRDGTLNYIPSKKGAAKIVNPEALYWPYNKNELINNPLLTQKSFYANSSDEGNYSTTR